MKKIIFGIVATLLLISCENDNLESINSDAKTNQILELKSENEQKLAYSLLNPEEKAIIWTKHLNSMKLLNSYNEEQINFINRFRFD